MKKYQIQQFILLNRNTLCSQSSRFYAVVFQNLLKTDKRAILLRLVTYSFITMNWASVVYSETTP